MFLITVERMKRGPREQTYRDYKKWLGVLNPHSRNELRICTTI